MWQPIETAPRDQTFLAVLNCAGEQTICTMRWPVAEAKNSRPDNKTFHVERVTHWMPLPELPGAQPTPKAVAYLDLGVGGYMDIGTDLTDEELGAIPKGRHMLGIVGTYGIDGYFPAQPAPSVPELIESLRCACNYIDKLGGVSQQYRAMLASPEANPAPSEQDESVRKSWARFSHELHRSPDAPYPGMSDAFEQHFSQSFTDREWRAEASTWAAAWKAAKRHCAQPALSVPNGWLRAIDEALVTAHIGVANAHDTYAQAKAKLDSLIGLHVDIATDPAVNGGWKLMPVEPTKEIYECFAAYDGTSYSNPFDFDDFSVDYAFALAAAPEAKP